MIIALSILLILLAFYCTSGTKAKYVSEDKLHSSVQVSLLLQGDEADLYESPNSLQTDGSYKLKDVNTKENVNGDATSVKLSRLNKYNYVLPGVNIPKDPKLFITKKSGAPAYLYLEVIEDNFPESYTNNGFVSKSEAASENSNETEAVRYELEAYWRLLEDKNGQPIYGKNGGKLYVFHNTSDAAFANYTLSEQKATYISSYIMKDDLNGEIGVDDYYGSNEVRKDKDGNEIKVPSFGIIKKDTIYVSEKYIHDEYYSTLATAAPIDVDNVKYNFGLYFYGYMASAKADGNFISPEQAYNNANFLTGEEYEKQLQNGN